jgi:hypothetical protein
MDTGTGILTADRISDPESRIRFHSIRLSAALAANAATTPIATVAPIICNTGVEEVANSTNATSVVVAASRTDANVARRAVVSAGKRAKNSA